MYNGVTPLEAADEITACNLAHAALLALAHEERATVAATMKAYSAYLAHALAPVASVDANRALRLRLRAERLICRQR